MNIDFHYFVIKTLAYAAGFSEEDAQTIAYYSQQVDDFTKSSPMRVRQKPPVYFIEKGYARRLENDLWEVQPHPTGIDVLKSLEEHYRRTTLVPFHFIPAKPLAEMEAENAFTRADYRCVRADDERAMLINLITDKAIEEVRMHKCERSLIQLGMAIHTYADTYAHCGYSGLEGWENSAFIKEAYNQMTGKEEVFSGERLAYRMLPPVGHGNSGHVPDACTYQIDVAMQEDERDTALTQHIVRDNLQEFLSCAKAIWELLCLAARSGRDRKIQWDRWKDRLTAGMQVLTGDENREKKLAAHWSLVFPEIIYAYDKDQRFYQSEGDGRAESAVKEELEELGEELGIASVYDVTDAFHMYNELAYRRAEQVLGTSEPLHRDEITVGDEEKAEITMEKNICDGDWEPESDLGRAVYAAGFFYLPGEDIICSTLNNVQRLGGYCRGYDEAAIAIHSVIDCEPIYFCYDGYEWMIELWKGQYGIETGCEIGVYYKEQDKPLSIAEETVLGKLYSCVPDERMLELRFTLCKNDRQLFARGWERHWWLTGFRWGLLSEPEQLQMVVGIRFPTRTMQRAFAHQGLEEMGYSYAETGDCSVEFCFAKPVTKQPDAREKLRKSVQTINREQVDAYNSFCRKYGITVNDPNIVNQAVNRQTGSSEGRLYEGLIRHFNGMAGIKEAIQKQTVQ